MPSSQDVALKSISLPPLIPSLMVFDFEQKVEYEGLHLIYFECEVYGNGSGDCPGIHQPGELMEKFESAPQQTTGDKPVGPTKSQSPYGPWMMPSFSRKQPSRQNKFQCQEKVVAAQQQTKLPVALDGWTMVGQNTAQDTSGSLPAQTEVGHKEKHKGPNGFKFNVLEGMKESVDHEEMINHLKQKLQAIQSPGARSKVGSGQLYQVVQNNRVG